MSGHGGKGDRSNLPDQPAVGARPKGAAHKLDLSPFSPDPLFDEIQELVLAGERGEITAAQAQRLERLVCEDPRARRLYAQYALETASLRVWAASPGTAAPVLLVDRPNGRDGDSPNFGEAPGERVPAGGRSRPGGSVPRFTGGLRALGAGWAATPGYLASHPMLAGYLVASLLFAVAGVIGTWVHVPLSSAPTAGGDFVDNDARLTRPGSDTIDESRPVGLVTATFDCRWVDAEAARAGREPSVPVGRKYGLAAGLMEITYRSGATVILEGPCSFEVDSPSGGFLSLGKLTARVETKGEGGRGKAEGADVGAAVKLPHQANGKQESPFPLPPSTFVIHTPTAVVTDLGTEFGVEVDRSGGTRSHVFQGRVELRRVANGVVSASAEKLSAGESVSVDAKGTVARVPATDSFVRDLRAVRAKAARQQREALLERFRTDPALVAYYAFDNERQAPGRLLNRAAATAGHLDGVLGEPGKPETRPAWTDGHAPGRRALRFDGDKNQVVIVPNDALLNIGESMTIVARVEHRFPMPPHGCTILSRRRQEEYFQGPPAVNYQLSVVGPHKESPYSIQLYTDGSGREECGAVLPQREEWWQVAATQAPGYKQFYLNGRLVDQASHGGEPQKLQVDLWIGAAPPWAGGRFPFNGLIDEIWIFKRVLSPAEMRALCDLGQSETQ